MATDGKLKLFDIKQLENNLNSLHVALNRANLKGSYELDEAVAIKTALDNITRSVEHLDKCQKIIVEHVNSQKKGPVTANTPSTKADQII